MTEPAPNLAAHPARREADHSTIARINYWFALRGFVMWASTVLALVITAFAFTKKWSEVPGRIAVLEIKADTLKSNQLLMMQTSTALVKLQCFNPAYTGDQLWAVGLDGECSSLYEAAEARRRVIQRNGNATDAQRGTAERLRRDAQTP